MQDHEGSDNEVYLQKLQQLKGEGGREKGVGNGADKFANDVLNFEIMKNAHDKAGNGYFGLAAKDLKQLDEIQEGGLGLKTTIEDFEFKHVTQLGGVLIKPIQDIISQCVRGMEESKKKVVAMAALETINAAQLIVPNATVLAGQCAYHLWNGDKELLLRNWDEIKNEIRWCVLALS